MDDYTLVLNAGSSSLKFCIYRRSASAPWALEARGQIEGIGTAPQLSAKDGAGTGLVDQKLEATVCDGRSALDALASWIRSRYAGSRVLAVGHRVVHGGARYARPTLVTPQVHGGPARADSARAAASAAQSGRDRSGERAAARRAAGRLLRHRVPPRSAGRRRAGPAPARALPRRNPALRLPRPLVRVHRVGPSRGRARDRRATRDRRPPRQRGEPVRDARTQEHRQHARVHRTRRAVHGHPARARSIPGSCSTCSRVSDSPTRRSRRSCTRSRGCSASPGSATTCACCSRAASPSARLAVDYFVYRAAKEIGALAAVLGGIDALVFCAGIGEHSAEIRRRICESSRWLGIELDADANARRGPRISRADSRTSAWVIPTNEELMIARHTSALLELGEVRA